MTKNGRERNKTKEIKKFRICPKVFSTASDKYSNRQECNIC